MRLFVGFVMQGHKLPEHQNKVHTLLYRYIHHYIVDVVDFSYRPLEKLI